MLCRKVVNCLSVISKIIFRHNNLFFPVMFKKVDSRRSGPILLYSRNMTIELFLLSDRCRISYLIKKTHPHFDTWVSFLIRCHILNFPWDKIIIIYFFKKLIEILSDVIICYMLIAIVIVLYWLLNIDWFEYKFTRYSHIKRTDRIHWKIMVQIRYKIKIGTIKIRKTVQNHTAKYIFSLMTFCDNTHKPLWFWGPPAAPTLGTVQLTLKH